MRSLRLAMPRRQGAGRDRQCEDGGDVNIRCHRAGGIASIAKGLATQERREKFLASRWQNADGNVKGRAGDQYGFRLVRVQAIERQASAVAHDNAAGRMG